MDEDFAIFLENFGPAIDKRRVPKASIDRYRGKLPTQLLEYWQEHGWAGYADGLFWTVNPEEYEPVLQAWIGDTDFVEHDTYHIIARSAFGVLLLWGERTGTSLTIMSLDYVAFPSEGDEKDIAEGRSDDAVKCIFRFSAPEDFEYENDAAELLFQPALQKLGQLEHDEMYSFIPSRALGGPATLARLQKVKAIEHLVFIAQLASLRVIVSPPA